METVFSKMERITRAIESTKRRVPDPLYVRALHYKHHKELPALRNPVKFADKIQWLKLHGGLDRYSQYADKYTVRPYVSEKIGAQYLIPLLGVWDRFDEIDFDELPNQFVLKATHACGYNFICKDKSKIDLVALKAMFDAWTSENFYFQERETQYKNCLPRIVCEKYLEDASGNLTDYKIWCSKGEPSVIQVDTDRFTAHRCDLLDTNWKPLSFVNVASFGGAEKVPSKPRELNQLLDVARRLSADFPYVRVDLYVVNGKIYFGELTFTPGSGLVKHEPEMAEVELGKLIDLSAYAV